MQNHEWRLLQEYRQHRTDGSFTKLTEPHLKLVFSTSLREVRDRSLAEDITQAVLLIFAKKAATLKPDTKLAGWFYQTARFVSRNAIQQEMRRKQREQEATQEIVRNGDHEMVAWTDIDPWINFALDHLGPADREAVLLHYFEGLSMREVGNALGVSEDAAKMRISRAVGKLRQCLLRQEIVISTTALAALLVTNAIDPVSAAAVQSLALTSSLGASYTANALALSKTAIHTIAKKQMAFVALKIACACLIGSAVMITAAQFRPAAHAAVVSNTYGPANPSAARYDAGILSPDNTGIASDSESVSPATSAAMQSLAAGVYVSSVDGVPGQPYSSITRQDADDNPQRESASDLYICPFCGSFYPANEAKRMNYQETDGNVVHALYHVRVLPVGYHYAHTYKNR